MNMSDVIVRRVKRDEATFYGHPKTREERWHTNFNLNKTNFQAQSLVNLLVKVMDKYLNSCIPIILYDHHVESVEGILLQTFFKAIKISYLHGMINMNYSVINQDLLKPNDKSCRSYIVFLSDVLRTREVLGPQTTNRVVLIPRSTQWKLQEFLSSKQASDLVNLLIIGESLTSDPSKEKPYVLYTHKLYTDGLGSNSAKVLTSWVKGKLSRPNVNLFPRKFTNGFSSHRFMVAAIEQPPFVLKALSTDITGNTRIDWDGYEIRLLKLMGDRLNFSIQIMEPEEISELGRTYSVIDLVESHSSDIGLAGAFMSNERMLRIEMSLPHSTDCAAFITLASKALPRYRAILGPFQWQVWVAIIFTYIFAIFPLAFSDRLTLSHLIGNWGEIENMFWYVFGTFTNSLTFTGEFSWSNTKKTSTRMLIGCYWVFSIIITACYTGSIIAFVTLPVFPDFIDTLDDLIYGFYRIGTLSKDGWQYWFQNSTDEDARKLVKSLEFVQDIEEGIGNVTGAFFWGYAFLGSRAHLQYIVTNNISMDEVGKKSTLHIAEQCYSSFGVSMMFPHNSVYAKLFNDIILSFAQSGLDLKLANDMAWDLQHSDAQQLIESTKSKSFSMDAVVERKLNLADTEGMFLLMAIGYILAGSVLFSEIVGGCAKSCRTFLRRNSQVSQSDMRRGSEFSLSRIEAEEPKMFSEKLKRGIRRRLRSKPKPVEEPKDESKPKEIVEPNGTDGKSELKEPELKGSMSFCTLKRIMLMRKKRKEEKKAQIEENNVIGVAEDEPTKSNFENYLDFEQGPIGGEQITIEHEKSNGDSGDGASLLGSSSVYSESHIMKKETEAEVNQLTVSDRENNPSKEFGDIV
ncbi:ionotropic receptor 21a [Sitodiplosis mosellana]|uniref:ionotropic receptor 21a n=1 Tax=Sitodiplosis mosellana TaxID=263140 RepID=UPI0024444AB3|nr:ionotropic receptor 21a [Sitodiplosis mosellana]